MGSNSSLQNKSTSTELIHNPNYGGDVIYSKHTQTVYQKYVLDENQFQIISRFLQKRKNINHKNLITAKLSFTKPHEKDHFDCSQESKLELYIEYFYISNNLQQIIESSYQKKCFLTEKFVSNVFTEVIRVLKYLKDIGECHGDIKSSSIMFDHLDQVKLIDSFFVHQGKTSYQIVMDNPSSMSLLSPQQLARIKHKQFDDIDSIHKSEIFAVGLTMIEALTLESAMECYNLDSLQIKQDYLKLKISELKQMKYSNRLVSLVEKCVAYDESERPTFEEFLKILPRGN